MRIASNDETRAINAVTHYCASQPEGSSPHSMLFHHRAGVARAAVAAVDETARAIRVAAHTVVAFWENGTREELDKAIAGLRDALDRRDIPTLSLVALPDETI